MSRGGLIAIGLCVGVVGCAKADEPNGSAKPSAGRVVSKVVSQPVAENRVVAPAKEKEALTVTAKTPDLEWLKNAVISRELVVVAAVTKTVPDGTFGSPPQVTVKIDSVVSGSMNVRAADIVWRPGRPELRCGTEPEEQQERYARQPVAAPEAGTYFLWFDHQRVRQFAPKSPDAVAAVDAGKARKKQLQATTFFVSQPGEDLFSWPKGAPSIRELQKLSEGTAADTQVSGAYNKLPAELLAEIQRRAHGFVVMDDGRVYRVYAGCGVSLPNTCKRGTYSSIFAKPLYPVELPSAAVAPTDGDGTAVSREQYKKHEGFYDQFRDKHPDIVSNGKIYGYGMLLGATY